MNFEEILDQAMAMLQRRGRVTYRTLQRQFQLDDEALRDLTDALLYAHARAVVASFSDLDTLGRDATRPGRPSVRWVLVHMIEEYARHNGHADLLREVIDGVVGT